MRSLTRARLLTGRQTSSEHSSTTCYLTRLTNDATSAVSSRSVNPVVYCADIGSVPNGRFGWARSEPDETTIERHRGGTEIIDLADGVGEDLAAGQPVALGFECPLFVPVPRASSASR